MKDDTKDRRRQVLRRLSRAAPGETISLAYWEIEILLDYIKLLQWGCKHGSTDGKKADSTGADESVGVRSR